MRLFISVSPVGNRKKNTVIVIVGPTAVGKTAVAIQLAQHFNTEIISADSRQCYKELNIGVAKPSGKELAGVHHYFINSHSIHDAVNAGTFEQYALQAADTIFQQNNIAVMVGGTGLYIKAFCEGIDEIPPADETTRKNIITEYEKNGINWLQKQVAEKDPAFWQIAERQNPHRLIRALEVLLATGRSITTFRLQQKKERPFNIIKIGLNLTKEQLYHNINHRVDVMMRQGLLQEAESLAPYSGLNALQTVGYKELYEYIGGAVSFEKAVDNIKLNTRHYAKRQTTWFKKDGSVQWVHPAEISFHNIENTIS